MIKALIRLLTLGIIVLAVLFFLTPRFISGAGNSLVSSTDNSSASGVAQLIPDSQGKHTMLQVKLDGLQPKTRYDITLNEDQCNGPIVNDAGTVTADQNGGSVSQSLVAKLSDSAKHTFWLNIHLGGDASGTTIACGQVQLNDQAFSGIQSPNQADTSSQQAPTNLQSQQEQSVLESVGSGQGSNIPNELRNRVLGYPQTGVAPAEKDTYDNYTFPRKY